MLPPLPLSGGDDEDGAGEEGEGGEYEEPTPGGAGAGDHELPRTESAASAASFWVHLLRESWIELQVGAAADSGLSRGPGRVGSGPLGEDSGTAVCQLRGWAEEAGRKPREGKPAGLFVVC